MILVADSQGRFTMASAAHDFSAAQLAADGEVASAPIVDDRGDSIGTVFVVGEPREHAESLAQQAALDAGHLMQLARGDHARPLDLHRVIEVVVASRPELELDLVIDHQPLLVTIPERRIERALANLLDNAVEAGATKIMLAVRRDRRRQRALVELIDDGAGIAPDVRPQMFDAFFTTKPHGTGLGLAVVRGVVDRYGGALSFESTIGVGTTFTLDLPKSR